MKIAGIVTLYHPDKNVAENILSYLDSLDVLYVVDNTENSNNLGILPKSKKIVYINNLDNLGVAKALNIGCTLAIENKYSWILTMDQDSNFDSKNINQLIEHIKNNDCSNVGIITPWHVINVQTEKPKEQIDYPFEVMTSGNIVNLEAYLKIGGFKDDYFIDNVDIEYCMNLNLHNYKIVRLNYIELKHSLGEICIKKIFKKKFICSNHNFIRRYYMTRNTFKLCDEYQKYFPEYCKFLKRCLRGQLTNIILFEKDKIRKVKMMIKGYKDYKKGIYGKYINN